MFSQQISAEYQKLMDEKWKFMDLPWPSFEKSKYHRSIKKSVNDINMIKNFILDRLGILPVFFFLVVIFGQKEYPGPYNNADKGLLILYFLLTGSTMEEMGRFIPRSSFYALYRDFFIKNRDRLNIFLDECLQSMFTSLRIRILSAQLLNPTSFKHITLMIDGHDTRASYTRANDSGKSYSYKLKKSGFRTQMCIDVNGMIIFVSDSSPCALNNDGSMLCAIDLKDIISSYDVVALDGGYTLFIQ